MPELPEVETVKEGLKSLGVLGKKVGDIVFLRDNLRNIMPVEIPDIFRGAKLLDIRRRAKYLLFVTNQGVLISHLGMTGTWRLKPAEEEFRTHDHIQIEFGTKTLVYNDPRRFGFFDYVKDLDPPNKYLDHLGPEPLAKVFTGDYLFDRSRKKSVALKVFIMDQKFVVGVGNIYACEALFLSGLRPGKAASRVSKEQYSILVGYIKKVLKRAIKAGGSTISDFKQAGGESGYFQHDFKVYGRAGKACVSCEAVIKNKTLGGRSSFYCPKCQS